MTNLFTKYRVEKYSSNIPEEIIQKVSSMVIGDGNCNYTNSENNKLFLNNPRDKLEIVSITKGTNTYIVSAKIPPEIEPYTIREIGLADKENNILWVSSCEINPKVESFKSETILAIQIGISNINKESEENNEC